VSTGGVLENGKNLIAQQRGSLAEVAKQFLRLGFIAYGGPAAHVAMMEEELVRRRRWLTREQFLDLVGAVNLLPGPSSTELAIYLGEVRAGLPGLIVAGACFILPAAFLVGALAWAYMRFGAVPQVAGLLFGIKPVVVALIAQAVWNLGRTDGVARCAAGCAGPGRDFAGDGGGSRDVVVDRRRIALDGAA
jgi:chromate transporter